MTDKTYKKSVPNAKVLPLFRWAEREAIRDLSPFARHIARTTGAKPSTARLYAELASARKED